LNIQEITFKNYVRRQTSIINTDTKGLYRETKDLTTHPPQSHVFIAGS